MTCPSCDSGGMCTGRGYCPMLVYDRSPSPLEKQREALMVYLRAKVDAEDWHAVSDAANDLREVEAELRAAPCR